MASEVSFETREGTVHALYEMFPLGGDADKPKVLCVALQNESGGPARRIKADSDEHKALVKKHPELNDLEKPKDEAA